MQAAEEDNFFEGCVYYASGALPLELSDGERYKGLRPVYMVSFLNYHLKHDDESLWDTDYFISYWQFTERTHRVVNPEVVLLSLLENDAVHQRGEVVTSSAELFYIFRNSEAWKGPRKGGEESRRIPGNSPRVEVRVRKKKLKKRKKKKNETSGRWPRAAPGGIG